MVKLFLIVYAETAMMQTINYNKSISIKGLTNHCRPKVCQNILNSPLQSVHDSQPSHSSFS